MRTLAFVRAIFLVVGLGLLTGAAWSWQRTSAFVAEASRAQGTVIALEVSRNNDNDGNTYRPTVRFETADGRAIVFTSTLGSNPPAYHEGEVVTVLYRPADPNDAEIGDFMSLWFATLMFGVIGGVFAVVGAGMFLVPMWRDRRDAALRATGQRITATLKGVELNTSVRVNNRSPWQVVAEWKDPVTGKVHELRSRNLWTDPTPELKGDTVAAFVDPADPKRHVLDLPFLAGPRG